MKTNELVVSKDRETWRELVVYNHPTREREREREREN